MEGDRYPEQYDARFEISIHALRVEGDSMREVVTLKEYYISIHALRVEGDVIYIFIFVFVPSISIHALRVEGDHQHSTRIRPRCNFYPRPPGGGRRRYHNCKVAAILFLSTPSGWRATVSFADRLGKIDISIHALRVEGDHAFFAW